MSEHFRKFRPLLLGSRWMVTADHPLAVQAAASLLDTGADAVDAAVMANLVMSVVNPHMCGFGGDLFALVYRADDKRIRALDAAGFAPRSASLEAYCERGIQEMPATGIYTCTVPGALAGWQALLADYGTHGLDTLLAKVIPLARDGFPAYDRLLEVIAKKKDQLARSTTAAAIFLRGGRPPRVGDLIRQPQLADSYRLIAEQGPDAFYRGRLGTNLVSHSSDLGGFFAAEDLADYRVIWKEPLQGRYRDFILCTQPPPSQGLALLMQAHILENFDLRSMAPGSADLVHTMVEAKKLAFSERDQFICDPDFHDIPLPDLLARETALEQSGRIGEQAQPQTCRSRFARAGEDTVYLTVVDDEGNAVVLIQSLFQGFGSCTMVPESGMLLHNRGRGFSMNPSHPNRLEPRKRPYHTLHPLMVLKSDRPYLLLGTPGGDGQTQTNIQLLTALIDFQADVQAAVDAPRWRSQPDGSLLLEDRFPQKTIEQLLKRGHDIRATDSFAPEMGSAQAVYLDSDRGILMGGADSRRMAYGLCR